MIKLLLSYIFSFEAQFKLIKLKTMITECYCFLQKNCYENKYCNDVSFTNLAMRYVAFDLKELTCYKTLLLHVHNYECTIKR